MSRPTEEEYAVLDRYLETVFSLLEGMAGIEEARERLARYLEWHRREGLDPELEDFLIELFFEKCGKEFAGVEQGED